jgi:hypothetical protein
MQKEQLQKVDLNEGNLVSGVEASSSAEKFQAFAKKHHTLVTAVLGSLTLAAALSINGAPAFAEDGFDETPANGNVPEASQQKLQINNNQLKSISLPPSELRSTLGNIRSDNRQDSAGGNQLQVGLKNSSTREGNQQDIYATGSVGVGNDLRLEAGASIVGVGSGNERVGYEAKFTISDGINKTNLTFDRARQAATDQCNRDIKAMKENTGTKFDGVDGVRQYEKYIETCRAGYMKPTNLQN